MNIYIKNKKNINCMKEKNYINYHLVDDRYYLTVMIQLKKYNGFEIIYFFSVDKRRNDIFKIGRSRDILNRLRNYNVGKIKETDLKYLALVKNSVLIENCIKK
jgi:hypothetical protein